MVPSLATTAHATETTSHHSSVEQHKQPAHRASRAKNVHRVSKAPAVVHVRHHSDVRHAMYLADPSGEAGGPAQVGLASWYGGHRWEGGSRTSSGMVYNPEALTAAHATLPMGTRVRVTLVGSNREVIVTINDRPGTRTRVIDLSRAAARELGILSRGVAMVSLTPL